MDVEVAIADQAEEYALKDTGVQQWLLEGYPYDKRKVAKNAELNTMVEFDVADVIQADSVTEQVHRNALMFTWAHR